jgi:hypothetical protein
MSAAKRLTLSDIDSAVLDAKELAAVLGCRPGTVYQMAREEMPEHIRDNVVRYARIKVGNRGVAFSKCLLKAAGIE